MAPVGDEATVEAGVIVGEGCTIWPGAVVRAGAVLGPRCTIGRGAYVDAGVRIGPDGKVQDRALLYAPARLDAGVLIGPGVILTNDRRPRAVGPGLPVGGGAHRGGRVIRLRRR